MRRSHQERTGDGRPGRLSSLRSARLVVVVVALLLLAAACGSSGDEATTDAFDGGGESAERPAVPATVEVEREAGGEGGSNLEAADEEQATEEAEADSGSDLAQSAQTAQSSDDKATDDSPLGAGGTSVTPTAADLGRKLIFTAFVNVEVDDVAVASAEATSIVEAMGGFLFGQNTTGGPQASSELIFKVLPDDFNRALEQLGTVGELRNQSVTTDDVTERIVDLESRIEVADLGVARLRAALEGAATLEDYAEIERLLLDRESNLEVMRGQLRTLQDRVDLATITLLLTQDRVENAIELRISSYLDHDNGESCPGQELNSIEADSELTVCFDIVNVGDQTLTDIVLTDTVLEIDGDTQLIEVFGSLDELAPGQAALVALEVKPERSLRLRTRVVAIPTDGVTSAQAGPSVSTQVGYDIQTFEPDRDPGFGDGFSSALGILKGLWIGLVVVVGFLIPLLILLPFLWLAWRAFKALQGRRPPRPKTSGFGGSQPPPPPPTPTDRPAAPTGDPAGSTSGRWRSTDSTGATESGGATTTAVADPPPVDSNDPVADPDPDPGPG